MPIPKVRITLSPNGHGDAAKSTVITSVLEAEMDEETQDRIASKVLQRIDEQMSARR